MKYSPWYFTRIGLSLARNSAKRLVMNNTLKMIRDQ